MIIGLLQWRLGLWGHRHQVAMDKWDRIQQSYREQIESAEKRNSTEEAARLRQEYEAQLEAWRAQQGYAALAPRSITLEGTPSLTAPETERRRALLAASDALNPGALSAEDYFLRGNGYYDAGDYQETLANYDSALAFDSSDPRFWYNRGNALHRLERYEEALELNPSHANTWQNRGVTLQKIGREEEAQESFRSP